MPITNAWSRLTTDALDVIPQRSGVYELATLVRNTLLLGRSAGKDLRACLNDELAKRDSLARQQGLYFRYEVTQTDDQRYRELLDEYRRKHSGKVPPLNERHVENEQPQGEVKRFAQGGARGQLRVVSR